MITFYNYIYIIKNTDTNSFRYKLLIIFYKLNIELILNHLPSQRLIF